MNHYSQNTDTIAAIATAPGKAAIGVIRLSGPEAIDIAGKAFSGKDLGQVPSHTIHYGKICNKEGAMLDQVLVSVFKAPHSYTGEDVVEISCHGSMYVLQEVMDVLLNFGVRHAQAGEFTLRAFLNGKLDLSQAEAVADIIDSEAMAAHQTAIRHIRGDFSKRLGELRDKLLNLSALIELELDFSEEDVEFADTQQLRLLLNEIRNEINNLAGSFKLGNVIKKGVSVVIAGKPNAGKSTLLNCLLQEERAITSSIPGTTRDYIEDSINIDGILFRFADTAGLTQSVDILEKEGIRKSREKIGKADVVIYLFDMEKDGMEDILADTNMLQLQVPCLFAANKTDKMDPLVLHERKTALKQHLHPLVFISSKYHEHIEDLKTELFSMLQLERIKGDHTLITNVRHFNILRSVVNYINDVEQGLDRKLSGELIALDLRHVINLLGEITGTVTNQDVLEAIFSRFCIGK